MDAISALENQEQTTPLNLMGLSPEEIRGVSAGRIGREQMMGQMLNLLAGQKGREATIAGQEASRKLTEAKTRKLEEPIEMTNITDAEGNTFKIPQKDIVAGMTYLNRVKRNKVLNLLTQEQIKASEKKMPITIGEDTYDVSAGHYAAISEATRKRKEAERKETASNALIGVSPEDMSKPEHFNNLIIANPGAATTILNRLVPEDLVGLSDAHYRHYANLHVTLSNNVLKMRDPDEALINTINNLSSKLRTSHMMLRIKDPSWFTLPGATKAITVSLPPNVTADMVYEEAVKQGVDVSEILQNIYDRMQESK